MSFSDLIQRIKRYCASHHRPVVLGGDQSSSISSDTAASRFLTLDRIDELLRFLPLFDVPGREYTIAWAGNERTSSGAVTLPYPVYCEDVLEFFLLAGQPWWSDFEYEPRKAYRMLYDDRFVETCTLDQIRTMLTYCVRGERFSDGHWEHVLQQGRIVALLKRLAALRAAAQAPDIEG